MVQWLSIRFPPTWAGFDSRTRRHMWVEFVVLAVRGFSPVFPSPQNPTFPNPNLIWNSRATGLSVIAVSPSLNKAYLFIYLFIYFKKKRQVSYISSAMFFASVCSMICENRKERFDLLAVAIRSAYRLTHNMMEANLFGSNISFCKIVVDYPVISGMILGTCRSEYMYIDSQFQPVTPQNPLSYPFFTSRHAKGP